MASKEASELLPPLPHPETSPPPGAPAPATLWYPSCPQTLQWGQSRGAGRHPTTGDAQVLDLGRGDPVREPRGGHPDSHRDAAADCPLGMAMERLWGSRRWAPHREEHAAVPAGFPSQSQGRRWAPPPLGKPCPTGGFCPEPCNAINIPAPVAGMSALL